MQFQVLCYIILMFLLNACYIKEKVIDPCQGCACSQVGCGTTKLQKASEGEWKKDDTLSVLCAKGTAIGGEDAEAVCYSNRKLLSSISVHNSFGKIKKHTVSVCVKDEKVLNTSPVCLEGTQPVCGYQKDVSEFVNSSVKPICGARIGGGSTQYVVCPYGGKAVCIKEDWNLQAYCVNDKNLLLSDKWTSGETDSYSCNSSTEFFRDYHTWDLSPCVYDEDYYKGGKTQKYSHISCSDEISVPKCL